MAIARILMLILMLVCGLCPSAAHAAPVSLGIFWVDSNGVRQSSLAQHWQAPLQAALKAPGMDPVHLVEPLAADSPVGSLPRLLCAARWAEQGLATPWILVVSVGPDDAPNISGWLVDLQGDRPQYRFSGGRITAVGWSHVARFVHQAMEEQAREADAVVGLQDSHLYHAQAATHLPAAGGRAFASGAEARLAGFHACPICFPASSGVTDDTVEQTLGQDVSRSIESRYMLDHDKGRQERVARVGRRVVEANHLTDYSYTFNVLSSRHINAFSAGAGHVYITDSLLRLLETDDELAVVLGHEIGHCEAHHVLRAYRQTETVNLVGVMLSLATGSSVSGVLSGFVGKFFTRGFSRSFELEADYRGLLYAHRAGFQADAFISALRKLKATAQSGSAAPAWLSTHPDSADRIDQVQRQLTALKQYDTEVARVRGYDPGLADALEQGVVSYLSQPTRVADFLHAYETLVPPAAPLPNTPEVDRDE